MYIIGVDDAGRGPLIGPMVLAGVLIKTADQDFLKESGVKDSKMLTQEKRLALDELIKSKSLGYKAVLVPPIEIDDAVLSGRNLNNLEAIKCAEVIDSLNTEDMHDKEIKVIVDCPSPNTKAWQAVLISHIKYSKNLKIKCEHKADANHPCVSAASVLAKLAREEAVAEIKSQYGNIGSGYLTDPVTQAFIKEKSAELENSGIFRKSWSTWTNLVAEKQQKKLFGIFF